MDNEIEEGEATKRALSPGSTEQGGSPANALLRYDGSGCALGNPSLRSSGERRDPSLGDHRTYCVNCGVVEECFHPWDAFVVANGFGLLIEYGICSSEEFRGYPGGPLLGTRDWAPRIPITAAAFSSFVALGEAAQFCCPSIIVTVSSSEEAERACSRRDGAGKGEEPGGSETCCYRVGAR